MVNLSSNAFLNETQNDYAKKTIAEAYMQTYQYAAEDFTTHPDIARFIQDLTQWMQSVDQRLAEQMQIISTHTHTIPPHVHGIIQHSVTTPVALQTLDPVSGDAIRWAPVNYPVYLNTSGTLPNLSGNKITISKASEGSINPQIRRLKPIDLTLAPTLSPTLKDALTPSLIT